MYGPIQYPTLEPVAWAFVAVTAAYLGSMLTSLTRRQPPGYLKLFGAFLGTTYLFGGAVALVFSFLSFWSTHP